MLVLSHDWPKIIHKCSTNGDQLCLESDYVAAGEDNNLVKVAKWKKCDFEVI